MTTPATIWSESPIESEAERTDRSALVVELRDVFARSDYRGPAAVELRIKQPVIDPRTGAVIGSSFVPTGMQPYRTLRGAVVFPALDRWLWRVTSGAPTPYEFEIRIDAPGLLVHSFEAPRPAAPTPFELRLKLQRPMNAQIVRTALLLPAPGYPFPAHVNVLHGAVMSASGVSPVHIRIRYAAPPAGPPLLVRHQSMTSSQYPERAVAGVASLAFAVGVPERGLPKAIDVYVEDGAGPVKSVPAPMSVNHHVTIPLP